MVSIENVSINSSFNDESDVEKASFDIESHNSDVSQTETIRPNGLTFLGATAHITVNNMGSGILLLPRAFADGGYIYAALALGLAGYLVSIMCSLMVDVMNLAKTIAPKKRFDQMEEVAKFAFGKYANHFVTVILYLTMYITCTCFVVLLGETLNNIHPLIHDMERLSKFAYRCMVICVLVVLAWPRDMSIIAKTSIIGVCFTIINTITICTASIVHMVTPTPGVPAPTHTPLHSNVLDLLSVYCTFCFSYGAVMIVPTIKQDMAHGSHLKPAISLAHVITTTIYMIVAVVAYWGFGDNVEGDVIVSIGKASHLAVFKWIASIAIIITIVLAYPTNMFCLNRKLEDLLSIENRGLSLLSRTLVVLSTLALASTPIGFFKELVGLVPAVTLTMICLIWPPVFYWKLLVMRDGSFAKVVKKQKLKFIFHSIIIFMALIAMVVGFYNALLALIHKLHTTA